ncbi:MAG: TRAP transporter small permease [Syntrophaceae bacterium]|nr:TRAP transporter small permease [Syntrophaceae bacterium]
MKKFTHKVNQVLAGFCGWLMLAMMLLLVLDVVTRFIGQPMQGMAELSVFVMMVVIYLGLARCEERREHVGLELLRNFLPKRKRKRLDWINALLAVVTVGIFSYAIIDNAIFSFTRNESLEGTVDLPIWPTKFIIVVGIVFYMIQTFLNWLDATKGSAEEPLGRDLF